MTPTIFALSSGAPPAAIAIVRISGPAACAALAELTVAVAQPRRATLAPLAWRGEHLDTALILFFPGPGSATGEDLVELHLHGGRATVAKVLETLGEVEGLEPAKAGEFTRRAFENGRIDLAEAEGLADLLFAETEQQRRGALDMAEGRFSREVGAWRDRVIGLSARIEAQLDFADEDDVTVDPALDADIRALALELQAALERPSADQLRDGVRVAIAGPPNAGKSTLLNRLADRDVAIVSVHAGTTRDAIEVPVVIDGRAMILTDTAGVRDNTDDVIERMGIDRAREITSRSDVVLWLGDDPAALPSGAIWVWPRSDEPSRPVPAGPHLAISALTGEGMSELVQSIVTVHDRLLPREALSHLNGRQRACLVEASGALQPNGDDLLTAEGLRRARGAFDRLLGKESTETMLDSLFSNFCIGK